MPITTTSTKQTITLNESNKKNMTLKQLRLSIDKETDKQYLDLYWYIKKVLELKVNNALCKGIILWILEGKSTKWITDMVLNLNINKMHVDAMNGRV